MRFIPVVSLLGALSLAGCATEEEPENPLLMGRTIEEPSAPDEQERRLEQILGTANVTLIHALVDQP